MDMTVKSLERGIVTIPVFLAFKGHPVRAVHGKQDCLSPLPQLGAVARSRRGSLLRSPMGLQQSQTSVLEHYYFRLCTHMYPEAISNSE